MRCGVSSRSAPHWQETLERAEGWQAKCQEMQGWPGRAPTGLEASQRMQGLAVGAGAAEWGRRYPKSEISKAIKGAKRSGGDTIAKNLEADGLRQAAAASNFTNAIHSGARPLSMNWGLPSWRDSRT